jgi:hypothetical protein
VVRLNATSRGWSAIGESARAGHLTILKRLGPDPARDDFGELHRLAKYDSVVVFLATIQRPQDLTSILSWHLRMLEDRLPSASRSGTGAIEALLKCGARWEKAAPEELARIRGLSSENDHVAPAANGNLFAGDLRVADPDTQDAATANRIGAYTEATQQA